MKLKYIVILSAALCLLTGCGGKKVSTSSESAKASSSTVTTTVSTTTTAVSTTTSVTTTKPKCDPPKDLVLKGLDSVEVYEDISLESFITEKNVELKDGSVKLNTSDTGVFEVEIPYIYNGCEFTQKLQYSVMDTTPPVVLNAGWEPNHKVGTPFDLNDYVGFADNFDSNPVLTFTGDIDPDKVGLYPLTATVTDSSGNFTTWDLKICVLNEVPRPVDDNPRVNYSDFIAQYNRDGVRFGIDVSAWQTDVDYNAVKAAGCSFVIIRVGYFYSEIKMDDYFRENIKNATEAGLDVGVYFYTTDNTQEGVREHARWIAEQVKGYDLQMPVAFDWEDFGQFQNYEMSFITLNRLYDAFAEELGSAGYDCMLYGSKNYLEKIWADTDTRPVWLAHYTDQTNYKGPYRIWQASCTGRINGIDGDVDMDILYD